jgi:Predicted pPIWI-associating nuclease
MRRSLDDAMKTIASAPVQRQLTVMRQQMNAVEQVGKQSRELLERIRRAALPPDLGERLRSSGRLAAQIQSTTTSSSLERMAEQIRTATSPVAGRTLAEQLRVIDSVTPVRLQALQLRMTADIAKLALGNSGIAAWRSSLEAATRVQVLTTMHPAGDPAVLANLVRTSQYSLRLSTRVSELDPTGRLIGSVAVPPLRALASSLQAQPSPRRLLVASIAGVNVGAVMSAETLSGPLDDSVNDEIAGDARGQVIEPWREAPLRARELLYQRLSTIDPSVPELLDGAWDDIDRDGPAAVTKIANCAMEAIDRTLRAIAPDEQVLGWHTDTGRSIGELHEGRPTRPLRVRYALEGRKGEVKLGLAQVDAAVALVKALPGPLQAAKHTSDITVIVVQALLVSVEASLYYLLLA